ncbi:hypothetical protein C9374_000508 [Naegleria lovaniensis]|uniref:BLUF domain-containing protein n=1 Tax=Naegleria lovaniensis TaxID=51637 RepID=A0AA88KNT0_NAELO|nr:uncharacterized protein C9374_000508 [Naegleria lovaniensis]KAG2388344.1 hypothetical protein C9374_000508 [Naegleria lovaniensis]
MKKSRGSSNSGLRSPEPGLEQKASSSKAPTQKPQPNVMMRIHYASRNTSGYITEQTKESILRVAVPMNEKFNITGVLICVKDMFFQIIEGPKQHLEMLFENIMRDPRHCNITKLDSTLFQDEAERMFPAWYMKQLDGMSWSSDDLTSRAGKFKVQDAYCALKNMIATVLASEYLKQASSYNISMSKEDAYYVMMVDFMHYKKFLYHLHQIEGGYQLLVKFVGNMLEMIKRHDGKHIMLMESSILILFEKDIPDHALSVAVKLLENLDSFRKNVNREEMEAFYCNIGITKALLNYKKLTSLNNCISKVSRLQNAADSCAYCVVFDECVFDSVGLNSAWKSQNLLKKIVTEEEEVAFTIVNDKNIKVSKEEMMELLNRLH